MNESPRSKHTILVVEDTDDVRSLVKIFLELKGYHVVEATNGREAIERALQVHPALILMDLSMPILDGWAATRQLRQHAEMHDVPIIGLSAYCRGDWHQEAIEAGCNECVQKPVDNDVLEKVIAQLLKSRC